MLREGYEIYAVEPNINSHKKFQLFNVLDAIEKADIICVLVKHRQFLQYEIKKKLIKSQALDFCGSLFI